MKPVFISCWKGGESIYFRSIRRKSLTVVKKSSVILLLIPTQVKCELQKKRIRYKQETRKCTDFRYTTWKLAWPEISESQKKCSFIAGKYILDAIHSRPDHITPWSDILNESGKKTEYTSNTLLYRKKYIIFLWQPRRDFRKKLVVKNGCRYVRAHRLR